MWKGIRFGWHDFSSPAGGSRTITESDIAVGDGGGAGTGATRRDATDRDGYRGNFAGRSHIAGRMWASGRFSSFSYS